LGNGIRQVREPVQLKPLFDLDLEGGALLVWGHCDFSVGWRWKLPSIVVAGDTLAICGDLRSLPEPL
jgi:hypothetical protein